MDLPPDTVLVFDRDEGLIVFESFEHATNYLEAIDVSEGEYTAAYSLDGRVLVLTAPEPLRGPAVLTGTEGFDLTDLEQRVARYWQLHQVGRTPCTPVQTARFLIERDSQSPRGWLKRLTDRVAPRAR
ncbi:hypothetical protein [Streptomyces rhizosphaerihabitans]|uniref:hypothetical protein n=1 Tax=Streptomyces rhizosphaerihabitans TaxID=1266770 RepID=UPI0021BFF059|nr:hypothetical protein [Streptomyces rhizosphaerihabitans]MCT9009495.1 hypothetical protein [Streptomyces rhizosphaerihabitans]